ncbi:MAG TPA: antibiotic biosynthesis monooxygenase family protein [Gemmatimonadaceae bacterium]|nr:antibiotic biosynthesis monooxygenase family protein [Gemmatimonadaceae bacterium]
MVLTVLEATVAPERVADLRAAFEAAGAGRRPPGLVRSELLCDANVPTRWRVQTHWESRAALDAMRRQPGTPAGVLMFRAAGAEPALTVFEVTASLSGEAPADGELRR